MFAIGDVVVDCFIRLSDAEVKYDVNHEHSKLCVRFGDKVPYESFEDVFAVGNSANAAVAGARLGLKTALSAVVGNDERGTGCINNLKKENVVTEFITTDPILPTNYHFVLCYGPERTILVKHALYERKFVFPESVKWIYLSSIGKGTGALYPELVNYLNTHPDTKLAFQPGTYQMELGTEKLAEIYKRSELFICNREEAQRILKNEAEDIQTLLAGIHALGPKHTVITDGPKGLYYFDGTDSWFIPAFPDIAPPMQRTGAGDATASTIASMLAQGSTMEDAIRYALVNAMNVVQHVGAQKGLLSINDIEAHLSHAPENYTLTKI